MQKVLYYFFGISTFVSGVMGIYYIIYPSEIPSMGTIVALLVECIFSFILYIMLEPRPRKTEAQIKHDERIKNQGFTTILLLAAAIMIILFASSCSRSITVQEAANGKAKCGRNLR